MSVSRPALIACCLGLGALGAVAVSAAADVPDGAHKPATPADTTGNVYREHVPSGDATDLAPRLVPQAKLVKAARLYHRERRTVVRLRRALATSPDAEVALQVAGIVYRQDWRAMRSCWLSEGYRHGERYQRRIVRLNRAGSGASGPAQFMPGTFASTPFGRMDLFNVTAQAMATAWLWSRGGRNQWTGAGC